MGSLSCTCEETRWFPEVMPASKWSQQKHQVKPVVQQDKWWHSARHVRLYTIHPVICHVWVLVCHTEHRKQSKDNIQNPMGQIQMTKTTYWTQRYRRCLPSETWQSVQRHTKHLQLADDVLVDGKAEAPHDRSIINLFKNSRANNITINHDRFVFESKDLTFFNGNLTPQGYKVDP